VADPLPKMGRSMQGKCSLELTPWAKKKRSVITGIHLFNFPKNKKTKLGLGLVGADCSSCKGRSDAGLTPCYWAMSPVLFSSQNFSEWKSNATRTKKKAESKALLA